MASRWELQGLCLPCALRRRSGLWGGEAGCGENALVEGDEEALAAGEDGAVGALELGLVEELAVEGAVGFGGATEVSSDED